MIAAADDHTLPGTNFETVWNDLPTGSLIAGQYEVRGLLGEGGMGRVFEVFDLGLRRQVALKTSKFSEFDPSLEQEGRALAAIEHEGLPKVYALGRHGPRTFLVMERIRGLPLARHLDEREQRTLAYSPLEAVAILLRISKPLALVHDAGVAHRDIKPANVMMAGERVVVMDFGLVSPEYQTKPEAEIAGSPPYLAPEVIQQNVRPGQAYCADIYALGVLAYELLTFVTPFVSDDTRVLLLAHINQPAPDVRAMRPDVPAAFADLIARMLAKEPFERPSSMQEISWALEQIRDRLTPGAPALLPVLVVDDDSEDMLPLLRRLVEGWLPGVRVDCVADPVVATTMLAREHYGLMLLDLNMPTMSGLELLMYVRGSMGVHNPEIVVVSSQLHAVSRDLLRSLGVLSAVSKGPLLESQLRDIVLRWAGRAVSQWPSPRP